MTLQRLSIWKLVPNCVAAVYPGPWGRASDGAESRGGDRTWTQEEVWKFFTETLNP
jgi:hypothetical protein